MKARNRVHCETTSPFDSSTLRLLLKLFFSCLIYRSKLKWLFQFDWICHVKGLETRVSWEGESPYSKFVSSEAPQGHLLGPYRVVWVIKGENRLNHPTFGGCEEKINKKISTAYISRMCQKAAPKADEFQPNLALSEISSTFFFYPCPVPRWLMRCLNFTESNFACFNRRARSFLAPHALQCRVYMHVI